MNTKTIIFLLVHLSSLVTVIGLPTAHLVREPEDVTAVAGETVRLSCLVAGREESTTCQWTKDGFGLGQDLALPGYERYRMEDSQTGECSLVISPALLTDEAVYQCQVGTIRSRNVKLVVNSPPSLPYIAQAKMVDIIDINEGEEVELQCETSGSKPPAEIQWRDSKGDIILSNLLETINRDRQTNTFRTVSSIKIQPTEDMDLSCAAHSEAFPVMKESRKLSLRLNHKPRISLNVTAEHSVSAGQDLTITCSSQDKSHIHSYKWFINDEEVLESENTNTITIGNISEDLNRAEVRCLAENNVGETEVRARLNVVFSPQISRHPQSVVARPGEQVTFHCEASSNPAPSYVWVRGKDERIAGVSDSLSLTAGPDTEDIYKCKVFHAGKELVSRPAYLRLLRPPTVLALQQRSARLGEAVILSCQVFSLDNSTKINWTRNNDPVRLDGTKYRALPAVKDEKLSTFSSDLIIYDLKTEDLGTYGCFAQNEIGSDHKQFLLEEERQTNYVAMIIAINTVVAVIILAGTVLWNRRKQILIWIRNVNQHRQQLPVVQRDVLPPIYRGQDQSVFEDLLLASQMGEKDYLKLSAEYKTPND